MTRQKIERIDPQEVIEAYRKTRLLPRSRDFIPVRVFGGRGCCALGVLAAVQEHEENNFCHFGRSLGLSNEFVIGFVYGFDGASTSGDTSSAGRLAGYKNGQEVRAAVAAALGEFI